MSMGGARHSLTAYTPVALLPEDFSANKHIAKHGLGILTATIFIAGEMAGSGVLALPAAMKGTGVWLGLSLIIIFTINAAFSGTRLGKCWIMCEERYPHLQGQVRDPYPTIGEKAIGMWGRHISTLCISLTLYGGGCVFIVLISQLASSLIFNTTGFQLSLCIWMVITALILTPLTWLGTPSDFWPIAVGALLTTSAACTLIIVRALLDHGKEGLMAVKYSEPTVEGSFKAFASIMFAFAGASTFPTIQADMKQREKFHISAIAACTILFLIYFPMAACCYYAFGADAQDNIVLSISDGPMKITVEIMLLLHLIAAFPIITNPPAQFFEFQFGIEPEFNWKRCAFRTFSVMTLLFIAETIPSFGSILDLVGASTVTLLTFVFPPYFYMRLIDKSSDNKDWIQRSIPTWERIYCWILIVMGLIGGICATIISVKNVVSSEFKMPCYLQSHNETLQISHGNH